MYPYIREMSAYTLLRPFFRAKQSSSTLGREAYLAADNWVLDTESPDFPNAPPGRSQEYNDETHPHLELDRTMVSIPEVRRATRPGGTQVSTHRCGGLELR